jgi:hypothetical protein
VKTTSLEWALRYAELGLRVIPIVRKHKMPAMEGWRDAATDSSVTIRGWWEGGFRACDVGIVTGAGSDIFVLDVDPGRGGEEALASLVREHGPLPDTVECLTGGRGTHHYFRMPEGIDIRNATDVAGYRGLDVRGEGGFVVAPPSVHESDRSYEWEASSTIGEVEIAPAPGWLLDLLRAGRENGSSQGHRRRPSVTPARIPVGCRNSTLASLAGRLRRDGYDPEEIEPLLLKVRERRCDGLDESGAPFPEEEVLAIAEGMARYEPAHTIGIVRRGSPLAQESWRSLAEIMAGEKPERPPPILGDGLIPERSLAVLYGQSNLGKTYLVLTLILSVVAGRDFFGWQTRPCNVLYLCPELDLAEFWDRVEAIEAAECSRLAQDPDAPAVRRVLEQARERVFPVTGDMLPQLPDLNKPEDRKALVEACRAHEAKLLALDPFSFFRSGREGDNDEMISVMHGLHEIKVQADTTPLLVHHPRKGQQGKEDAGFDAMRGAGAIAAHSRVILRLEEKWGRLRLSCEKATHTRRSEPIWLDRLESGALVRTQPAADPSVERDERAEAVMAYVANQEGREIDLEEIMTAVPEVSDVKGPTVRGYLRREIEVEDREPRIEAVGTTKDRRWKARW